MKFQDHTNLRRPEMQLAPMVDVVFLLLIFFIVQWADVTYESDIDISTAAPEENSSDAPPPGEIVLKFFEDGHVEFNNSPLTLDDLYGRLSRVAVHAPSQPIILLGRDDASMETMVKVLNTCHKAGLRNVTFAEIHSSQLEEG